MFPSYGLRRRAVKFHSSRTACLRRARVHVPERILGAHAIYNWSKDKQRRDTKGWVVKADTLEELAKKIVAKDTWDKRRVSMRGLVDTVNKYNEYCAAGKDADSIDKRKI